MAAAEYFASTPNYSSPHSSSPYLNPPQPPQPQRTSSGPILTNRPQQGQPQAPPSYHTTPPEQRPGVHFAPSPAGGPPLRHSFSGQHRPSFSTTPPQNSYFPQQRPPYQASWSGPTPQAFHPPPTSNPAPGVPYGTPPAHNGYAPAPTSQHMRPYVNPNHSQYSLDNGYSSDPEPQRRRSKHKERHHSEASRDLRDAKSGSHHHHSSRSTNSDAFIGAAGGGLIGDLIFPGLGTLGGAALGWLGGKDYGNHRKWREEKRERDQKGWEEKFGHRDHHYHHGISHHRGHSHERQRDDKDRRHSHEN